ncbi:3-hydroxyacyl-CoA dehydrogenase NAD-binding domain-containing protein [Paracoccus sp. TK19116]|uniref:3-hydroxyacyl-CoA dehydrogenase NAD-binding domain-containing protein n=1 Tax=Paracoccus albicereus TaxID=2922394 RepID=A0ABT1MQE6_9RHOB|nr:3-hydroxyacyl-CoA dehydrogenase NAD-binding domain-containing protein [Paracoccus albicereus]MCQ0969573.1 3-hydroxyacyl-CoA dehydrogenase NAD-binding domain-containing protein [Paracoccus albicereus]
MQPVTMHVREGIAHVVIDSPPVNALSQPVRASLADAVARVEQDSQIAGVVLSCAGRTFVAGADINELGAPLTPYLPDILADIAASRVPWVAAIKGTALGGGLELAMACHGRIAEPSAKMGLPEVSLGILPGAGGTVRLPRLVPMTTAITMITAGKPIDAKAALDAGLVDILAETDLLSEAEALLHDLPMGIPLLERPVRDADAIDWDAEQKTLRKKSQGAQAPLEALAALHDAASLSAEQALAAERDRFLRLAVSDQSRALRHVFFAERAAGRSLRDLQAEPADLSCVGVIGGGTMGAGIAVALLLAGSQVILVERDEASAAKARTRVDETLTASAKRGVIDASGHAAALDRLKTAQDYGALTDCQLVIEAVFEDMALKREVFARLDAVMPASAILATNTSYLDVDALAGTTAHPDRVLGLHFFAPAHVMKLLEVVRGSATGPRALATAGALARHLRKIAVVACVCDGFIGNRIMNAYRNDCEFMLEEGALPQQIDAAMESFGFAMGIYKVQDLSGLDIAWAQRKARAATRPADERYAHIADRLCEAGRLGRKTGRGFYDYSDGKPKVDPEVTAIIEEESAKAARTRRDFTEREIIDRILTVMQAEGQAILDEGIAESADDIDVVMITGYGFPRHKGGPMWLTRG